MATETTPKTRIVAIHAHPDDIEFQCAGTLALLKNAGCEIVVATMTPGDCGSAEHNASEISAIRREEARQSALLLGAHYHCLEFRDLAIFVDDESRRRVVEFLRRAKPEIVITAPPVDYLVDHEATCALVRDACFAASAPNYVTREWDPAPALLSIPHLYFVDSLGGVDRDNKPIEPHFFVDASSTFDLKKRMLACHASQRNWLLRQHGIDEYIQMQETWSRARGQQAGFEHAEGFRQYLGHPYPQDNLLFELVGPHGRKSSSSEIREKGVPDPFPRLH